MTRGQEKTLTLMQELLGDDALQLDVRSHTLEEDVAAGRSTVRMILVDAQTGEDRQIGGGGVGLVDAAFGALMDMLVSEYPSLAHIRFDSFELTGATDTADRDSRTDALVSARLDVVNQVGRFFSFTDTSRSVGASSIRVTLAAVEYFVNSERAFLLARSFLDDAKAKGRPDLVDTYTRMLTQLVQNSSYAGSMTE